VAPRTPTTPPGLPGYRFARPLGTGGFSDVYLYEQLLPHRAVAVKVLLSDLGESGFASFTSEANLMARLSSHPFIVTIHDAGIAPDGRPYLVMEFCSRPNLAERYKTAPLSVTDTLRVGVQLASAVETAHRAGILHRDIKPGNVLTNDYGYPALTDFGIAAAADAAPIDHEGGGSDPEASTGGSIGLSVPWSPPEMFLDTPEHDPRSDVFSLAATLHTVLAGRTPFEIATGPNTPADLMSRIERGQVTDLGREDVPRTLVAVLNRGMSARREDRYPSALEFGRALQRIELELGLAPTTLEIVDSAQHGNVIVASPDDAETRVRSLPTVVPEAPRLQIPLSPVRPPIAARVAAAPAPGRARLVGALVAVLSVLAISVVALTIALSGVGVDRPDVEPAPTSTGVSAVGQGIVPVATDGAATPSADGTAVRFTWLNPDPREGDLYYWALAETPTSRQAVEEREVTVEGVAPGSRVCVNVEIGRAGRTSAALVICTGD
jgi:serine/threonine protein kinase